MRDAQDSRLLRLTLDVNDLRQELHRLTTLRALAESQCLARPGGAGEQLIRAYFTLYRHGLDLRCSEHAAFIRASLASDFALGTTPFGADMFFEQWARHTALFRLRFVELAALRLVPSDEDGSCVVRCAVRNHGRLSRATIAAMFPSALADAALVARLVDREIVTHASMAFYVDAERRITRLDVDVDMVAAFGELLCHNPYDVAALLGHVVIAEESMLGDDMMTGALTEAVEGLSKPSTGTRAHEVRLASGASVQGDDRVGLQELPQAQEDERLSLDFILS